jgi:aerobic-type carbon monoxide dehydrogenase small subunit (CoxS/CutS family)
MTDLIINGQPFSVDVPVGVSLAHVLREELGLTGTKVACGEGHCGACTVLLDGIPTYSCITLLHTVGGREVTTIEGLRDHALIGAFVRADAVQCGFCTPGQVVSASALIAANPKPSRDDVRHGMAGNICRCGTYPKIEEALLMVTDLIGTAAELDA